MKPSDADRAKAQAIFDSLIEGDSLKYRIAQAIADEREACAGWLFECDLVPEEIGAKFHNELIRARSGPLVCPECGGLYGSRTRAVDCKACEGES